MKVNALILSNLFEYRHKSYTAKTRFFGLDIHNYMGPSSTNLIQLALKANAFSIIMQSNGHYAIQVIQSHVTNFGPNQ